MLSVNPGLVGTVLVRFVPEFGGAVQKIVATEFEILSDQGEDVTTDISPFHVCSAFREVVLEPALRGLPDTADLVARCGRALAEVWEVAGPPGDLYREAVALRILDRLDQPERSRLLEAAPVLAGPVYRTQRQGD